MYLFPWKILLHSFSIEPKAFLFFFPVFYMNIHFLKNRQIDNFFIIRIISGMIYRELVRNRLVTEENRLRN